MCSLYRLSIVVVLACGWITSADLDAEQCFCKLKGQIGDCSCSVGTVDHFNNMKIYPRLKSLIVKDYFRFYKVNLKKECPFWSDDSRCAIRHCHVKPCMEEEIPPGLKGHSSKKNHEGEGAVHKYLQQNQAGCESDPDEELGNLNTTISPAAYEEFALWQAHDDAQDNFCTLPDEDGKAEYVDLLLNPERYTGYKGPSAHRIWRSIYKENCFRPKHSYGEFIQSSKLNDKVNLGMLGNEGGKWGENIEEFRRRFSPQNTKGEGPEWLRNLYFTYLLELRAIVKAAPYLERELYYTGNAEADQATRAAIADFLSVAKMFPEHFNESSMFSGGRQARKLKEEFRHHFRNISQIMDCVGCEKCKLWGKLQIQGLGTALKILFSGKFDKLDPDGSLLPADRRGFYLERSEIVALFNALARLSTSIYEIESFRRLMSLPPEDGTSETPSSVANMSSDNSKSLLVPDSSKQFIT